MDYNFYGFSKRQSISEGTPYSREHPHGNLGERQAGFLSQPQFGLPNFNSLHRRSAYYETHYPLYYCDWTNIQGNPNDYVALSSYSEDSTNKVQIVKGVREINEGDEEDIQFTRTGEVSVNYPVTKLQWDPQVASGRSCVPKLATSSECLRLYEYREKGEISQLVETAILSNPKNKSFHQLPPMTSMDWCSADPSYIITCSIDTTCTLWDVSKGAGVAKTQLIAHDSEVFDVQFLHNSQNLFASCGNDGSVRLFDLRCLDRSTIVYEPHNSSSTGDRVSSSAYNKRHPLLRISASNYNQNHITAIEADSNRLVVLDLRYAGSPIRILDHHAGNIDSVKWHPYKNFLLTVGDDCQAFIYDFNALEGSKPFTSTGSSNSMASGNSLKRVHTNGESDMPILAYSDTIELNNATWSSKGDWVGLVGGKGFQAVKVED